ncbi:MAG: gliding motility-associated C-terminal domain-containing protein [Saprospiraceae bacterium]|jgi:gliding motility-associated-like protein|nr:gliding motility-associated C-terminal domain-containing protein [Saprospiraceae bacterium]
MRQIDALGKKPIILLFLLLAFTRLSMACDTSGYTMNSITDNGNGTFTIQWTALVAGGTSTGVGSTWGFFLNIDANIVSISPTSFTSTNGTTLNAVIAGGNVQWGNPVPGSGPVFVDITTQPNDESFNFTMVVSGIPTEWWGGGQENNLCPGGNGTSLPNYEGEFPCFLPVLTPMPAVVHICPGEEAVLTVSPNHLVEDILWSVGNQTGTSITVSPASDETYTVTASNVSCESETTITVIVDPLPYLLPQEPNIEICEGTLAYIYVNADYTNQVTWSPGTTTGTTLVVLPATSPAIYTATGTNQCGSYSVEVVVTTILFPEVTVSPDVSICAGEAAKLVANPVGAPSVFWEPVGMGDNIISVSPTTTTTYTAVVSNSCGEAAEQVVVTVGGNTSNTLQLTTCAGETALYNGIPLAAGSTSTFTFNSASGCDSVVTVTVAALPNASGSLLLSACQGETASFMGQNLAPGSSTQFTLTAFNGCDSVLTVNVVGLNNFTSNLALQACAGETVTYAGQQLAPGSTTPFVFNAANGCDSTVTVTVQQLATYSSSLTLQTCTGTTVSYNGQQLAPNTTTPITLTAQNGCDSVVTVNVVELAVLTSSLDVEACTGTTFGYNGQQLLPGTSTDFSFTTASGCDSVVTVNVVEVTSFQEDLSFDACTGETITYNGQTLLPGSVTDFNFVASQGCDSTVTVTVLELPSFSSNLSLQTCPSTPVTYAGITLPPNSVTPITLMAQNGCDSVVTVTVEEIQVLTSQLDLAACDGNTVFYQGQNLTAGTVADFTFTSSLGCDSVVTVTVNALQSYTSSVALEACEGFTAIYNGVPLPPGTNIDFTFTANNGCDSVVTVTVAEVQSFQTLLNLETCPGTTASYNGQNLAIGSLTTFNFTAAAGCDSTVTVTVSALPTFASSLMLEACEGSFTTYNGQSVAAGTSNNFILTASNGCDSVVTVTVQAIEPVTSSLTLQACTGSSAFYQGQQLAPGSVTDFNLTSPATGCDSIVTVTVEEVDIITSEVTLAACPDNTVTYNGQQLAPGSVTDFPFVTPQGCDSIVTVTVQTLQDASSSLTLSACTGSTVTYNGQQLQPGSLTNFNFNTWQGCDSTVTVTVVENLPQATSLVLQACTGSTITYNGQTLQPNSVTEFSFDTWQGCDSTVTVTVQELDILTSSVTLEGCQGEPLSYNGTILQAGTSVDFEFISVNGCDSIVTVTALPYLPVQSTTEQIEICEGSTATIFGQPVTAAGEYSQTFSSANGCDSTHTVTLSFVNNVSVSFANEVTIALGDAVVLNPQATPPVGLTFTWQEDPTLSCTNCPKPTASPLATTTYSLTVSDQGGCRDEATVTVVVTNRKGVYIPNSFSPNGDGPNDVFMIFSNGKSVEKVNSFVIFSRWGESVFEVYNFPPDEIAFGWDGTHRGKLLDTGVFVYYAEIEFVDGTKQLYKGDVTLVR